METKMTEEIKKLEDTIQVTIVENNVAKEKIVKMSMGLLQALYSKFTSQDQIYNLGMDAIMQNMLVNEVLDDRDENGNRVSPAKNWAMFLSKEEGEKLNTWISEHIIDFFTSKLESQRKAMEKILPILEEVNKSNDKAQKMVKESKPA